MTETETRIPKLETELMAAIRSQWGALIAAACRPSSILPEFLAALIAGESGGRTDWAPRFEPNVYKHLAAVQQADIGMMGPNSLLRHRPAHYGAIYQHDLLGFSDAELRAFASSWGLTQIMGYHLIGQRNGLVAAQPRQLLDPRFNLDEALRLLGAFASEFNLEVTVEFEELFRCWNSGQPYGKTFAPQYVENGLRRLVIYREAVTSDK